MPEDTKTRMPPRQRMRLALIILSFILYPVTFAYISCPIITEAASRGIASGGLVVFALLFLSSLVVGRIWCGYLCPSGGLQEAFNLALKTPLRTKKADGLKYLIFAVIYGSLGYAIWSAGGLLTIDLLYRTEHGISILAPLGVVAFLGPVTIITVFTLIFGKRGFCHTFCPIAVMLMIGRKIRNLAGWPALRISANASRCIDCMKCSKECPMSLDVNGMVRKNEMENADCILCGACMDTCPKGAITFSWMEKAGVRS
ncbi:MAG TPA: 4Fe-4S binding protein [Methanoregulaceae archaeon]|nr:4Fe-4S binding protein [Methanoregulaceae archaeon]